jgi:hypothetical protein
MLFDIQRPLESLLGLLQLSAGIRWRTRGLTGIAEGEHECECRSNRPRGGRLLIGLSPDVGRLAEQTQIDRPCLRVPL